MTPSFSIFFLDEFENLTPDWFGNQEWVYYSHYLNKQPYMEENPKQEGSSSC